VRPGAVPFLFAPGQSAALLVDRLRGFGWRGQIVGPHGSGKSTLLAALTAEIRQAGRTVTLVELHDGQRRLPRELQRPDAIVARGVLIVDGYEQLGRIARWVLKRRCRRRDCGLLVTAHGPVGLPELFCTTVSLESAQRVVGHLQRGKPPHVAERDVAEPFARHDQNLREILFELYDLYEFRRQKTDGS
jgi:ABC-type uncharacterized transport system YnjBCD ATPase subunit